MRALVSTVSAALTVAGGAASGQGAWGHVKSWSGNVTIEATDVRKNTNYTSKMTYTATGEFSIPDEMLPDGSHVRWPMPSAESFSDPATAATAFDRWQAHVVATLEIDGVNEQGQPFSVSCRADSRKASKVGVQVDPTAPRYVVSVSAPEAPPFKCVGPKDGPQPDAARLQQVEFELTGPRGEPGRVGGSKVFTVPAGTIKVTYNMAPGR